MVTGVSILLAAAGLFWLGFRHPRRRRWLLTRRVIPVQPLAVARDQQHRCVGGIHLDTGAIAALAGRFNRMLRSGRTADVERELTPGGDFPIQVHALASTGHVDAGVILERQLSRRVSRDPATQTWFWVDLAAGLRRLPHGSALPAALRCANTTVDGAAATVLAAEIVAFPNFGMALASLSSALGQAALQALVRVASGCRSQVIDPAWMIQSGLGDHFATLSETAAGPVADPLLVKALLEAQRVYRRIGSWGRLHPCAERHANAQEARLRASQPNRVRLLIGSGDELASQFEASDAERKRGILRCAFELRTEVAHLFPRMPDRNVEWRSDAICCLTWSREDGTGAMLAVEAARCLSSRRQAHLAEPVLAALRGHASPASEAMLLRGASSALPGVRRAAATAMGWWPPFDPAAILAVLRRLYADPNGVVRRAALAALARLGDRPALDDISVGLASEDMAIRTSTAMLVADSELTWFWPDLQYAAETLDAESALAATESLESLRENLLGPLG